MRKQVARIGAAACGTSAARCVAMPAPKRYLREALHVCARILGLVILSGGEDLPNGRTDQPPGDAVARSGTRKA